MPLSCTICEHEHSEDGMCSCGCEAEQQVDEYCWACGHSAHNDRECKCGCSG